MKLQSFQVVAQTWYLYDSLERLNYNRAAEQNAGIFLEKDYSYGKTIVNKNEAPALLKGGLFSIPTSEVAEVKL